MTKTVSRIMFLILFMFLLVACGPRSYRAEDAWARDTIFSVEKSYGGAYSIFLTHDDSVLYCTEDTELGEAALNSLKEHRGDVLIRYRFVLSGDPELKILKATCDPYYNNGTEGDTFSTVKLLELYPIPSRTGE